MIISNLLMHSLIVRNTLLSPAGLERVSLVPQEEGICASLQEVLTKFQDIKKFASEIHTETHLVKPILKLLGYAYESKPKFFEEQIKGPDAVLFANEEERVKSSPLWGTQDYYANTLGILLLKRYGRNLEEGISGFYLEFENRIPVYQTIYLLNKTRTPWGILTNGKYWMLIHKPASYETRLISIDLEQGLFESNKETLHLFYNIFSLHGLLKTLPEIIEQERTDLIAILKEKKTSIRNSMQGLKKKAEIFPKVLDAYRQLFADGELPITEKYLLNAEVKIEKKDYLQPDSISGYNMSDISAYLFNKKGPGTTFNLEEVLLGKKTGYTKEDLLSLRILDMTPNFGNIAAELIEGIAYLSFILPYKEKNTFNTEWENETSLKRYIIDRILFGIEKSHIAYDILHDMMKNRFKAEARNYKFGNPLLGMSLSDIPNHFDIKSQLGLFTTNPEDVLAAFREMFKHYCSLSEKIKEDLPIRTELEIKLKTYASRIRDAMDIIVATYFSKGIDSKKIHEVLSNLDTDDRMWVRLSTQHWFLEAKGVAERNGFFHFEIEFPFLLNHAFDFIFVQPALQHIWEDAFPLVEVTKAYIRRAMPYLKEEGSLVIILEERLDDNLIQELAQSKRYETEMKKGFVLLKKKKTGHI